MKVYELWKDGNKIGLFKVDPSRGIKEFLSELFDACIVLDDHIIPDEILLKPRKSKKFKIR